MLITDRAEKIIGERNTRAFIHAHPVLVELHRPQMQETEAGGVRRIDPIKLPPQEFRIVPMSGLVWDRSRTTPDEGLVSDVSEMMVGMPDADIQKNDYFPHEEGWMKVVHVSPVRGYRREARLRFTETEPRAS